MCGVADGDFDLVYKDDKFNNIELDLKDIKVLKHDISEISALKKIQ